MPGWEELVRAVREALGRAAEDAGREGEALVLGAECLVGLCG